MSEYSYNANDESLLTPVLYKYFVDPLVKILPYRLPANLITLISFGFIVIAFTIAAHGYRVQRYDFWWAIPILSFLYIIGDCSDGKQARKTGTGSPLGEYFDHLLDTFVSGLLIGILMISFQVINPFIITIGFFNLYFGQIGTFWERYKRRVMSFGKLSTSEGILTIAITSSLVSVPVIHRIADIPAFFGITWSESIIVVIMLGAAITAIHALIRSKQVSFRLIAHFIFALVLTTLVASLYRDNMIYITVVITFYNVFFLASLLAATNLEKRETMPDIIVPLSCILFFILPDYAAYIRYGQIFYLMIRILIRFTAFFRLHRQYWYWINPPPSALPASNT